MSKFVSMVSLRYLKGSRRGVLSFIGFISISGMALGVAALITVMSVMDGFTHEMREHVLATSAHLNVYRLVGRFSDYEKVEKKLKKLDSVVAVTPIVQEEVLISGGSSVSGGIVNGVDIETLKAVINIPFVVTKGSFQSVTQTVFPKKSDSLDDFLEERAKLHQVVIGVDMAQKLEVSVGDTLSLVTSKEDENGTTIPINQKFIVGAIFDTGMYDYDSRFVYMDLKAAQKFANMEGEISYLAVDITEPDSADRNASELVDAIGGFPFGAQDWAAMNKTTFRFLNTQKAVMFIILAFIVLVASFGIVSTLIMLIMKKRREISILKTMGATHSMILRIFVFDGLLIGSIGIGLGMAIATAAGLFLREIHFPLAKSVYFFQTLPVEFSVANYVGVGVVSLLLVLIATLYPAWQASRITPVEGLRYD
ncbi:ABC transporter permease [bacterium]|nr:ABC transporter permease [bacterium]